jgi:excisionase family DNA binding protein
MLSLALQSPSDLLTQTEAAAYLGLSPNTLEVWRCTKRYELPYVKVGRLIRYRRSELDAWLDSRSVGGDRA